MIASNDARPGMILEIQNILYKVVGFHHNKTGRGGAVIKLKLKNLHTGATTEETFRPGDKFKRAIMDTQKMQYLYHDGEHYHFMNIESFEQIILDQNILEEALLYLKEEMVINIQLYKDKPVGIDLPLSIELKVTETDPGLRGDTVSGATKPAKMETGLVVQVPLFINEGDVLRIDTRTGDYIERG
jgi:elongation factor P